MKRIDIYIALALFRGVSLVLFGLLSIDLFMAVADELGDVKPGQYETADALIYVALTIPRRIFEQLPVATLAGTLVGVGALAGHSELVAMQAAGFSRTRIARSVAIAASIIALGLFVLSERVMPWSERYAHDFKFKQQGERLQQGRPGDVIWLRDQRRFLRAFRVQSSEGTRFLDIRLFELDENGRPLYRMGAQRLEIGEHAWVLKHVLELRFSDEGVSKRWLEELAIEPLGSPKLLDAGALKPRFLSLSDLAAIERQLEKRGMDSRVYRVAWWVHVINPFTLVVMSLFASSFLYGSVRGGTAGRRLLLGMILGLGFYMINRTAANVAQIYSVPEGLTVALPTLLILLASLWRYRRMA